MSLVLIAFTGLSVSWLFSSILTSPAIATVLGIATLATYYGTVAIAGIHIGNAPHWVEVTMVFGVPMVLGLASFAVGSILYLRRVEP